MIIEFRCKLCGKQTTRDVKTYKKGMNVCEQCVPNQTTNEPVKLHINTLGACL